MNASLNSTFAHLDEVEGWLDPRAANVTAYLMRYQSARNVVGDVMEIGVYHGKYFIVLLNAMAEDDIGVAIDIFGSQDPKIPSVQGDRAVFEENLKKWAPHARVVIMESDSTALKTYDVLIETGLDLRGTGHPFRFISIDGSHDEDSVARDLSLAEDLLTPGGVIALDDWSPQGNPQWPGVAAGEVRYQVEEPDTLYHIGAIPNKLLLTTDPFFVQEYQNVLRDYAQEEAP
jgi:hypothetical protein